MNLRLMLFPVVFALPLAAQAVAEKMPAPAQPTASAAAATPGKIAILQFQDGVLSTAEGKEATAALKAKFDPRKAKLEQKQAELQQLQDKLQKGSATLSADARNKMQNDLATGTRALKHDAEDLNSDVQEEEGRIMQSMSGKMGELIRNYATQNGFAVVLDVSSQQTPVIWASPVVNITADIVKLYDQAHPVKAAAAAPAKK